MEGALFNDDVIMTSLLLDFNPKKWGGERPPCPSAAYPFALDGTFEKSLGNISWLYD